MNNPTEKRNPTLSLDDPGARIRTIGLWIVGLCLLGGIVAVILGLDKMETTSPWIGVYGENHPSRTIVTENAAKCFAIGSILLLIAVAMVFPLLSLAAWRTSRWRCQTAKCMLEDTMVSPRRLSGLNFQGSIKGWIAFWTIVTIIGGIAFAVILLALVFDDETWIQFRLFGTDLDSFSIVASSLWGVFCGFLWVLCLRDQMTEVEGVVHMLSLSPQEDIQVWKKGQILSVVSNLVPIPGKSFKMGKHEVTQAQWEAVMGNVPSSFIGDNLPVEHVSWNDCQQFLRKLNSFEIIKDAGLTFRLPTEEEWEYCCRANATGEYCKLANGTEIDEHSLGQVAWFDDNSGNRTHPVGQKSPNAYGLYDMHGNVWEWTDTTDGEFRVNRGGSWNSAASNCASSHRVSNACPFRHSIIGFRLCADGKRDDSEEMERGQNDETLNASLTQAEK